MGSSMKKKEDKSSRNIKEMVDAYSPEYSIQSRRTSSDENDEIMDAAIGKVGHVKLRISPQIYDSENTRYVGLLGQQFRLNVYNSEQVLRLMDGLDALIEAGTLCPMDELITLIQEHAGTTKAK